MDGGDLCACLACSALCGLCCAAAEDDRRRRDYEYYHGAPGQRVVYVEPVAVQQQHGYYAQPQPYTNQQVVYAQPVQQQGYYPGYR